MAFQVKSGKRFIRMKDSRKLRVCPGPDPRCRMGDRVCASGTAGVSREGRQGAADASAAVVAEGDAIYLSDVVFFLGAWLLSPSSIQHLTSASTGFGMCLR